MFDMAVEMSDLTIEMTGINTPIHIEKFCRDLTEPHAIYITKEPKCFTVLRVEGTDPHTISTNQIEPTHVMIIDYRNGGRIILKSKQLTHWFWVDKDGATRIDNGEQYEENK